MKSQFNISFIVIPKIKSSWLVRMLGGYVILYAVGVVH